MKHKIFSLVLALALTLSGVNAMAATTDGIEVELKPENYAIAHLSNTGYSSHTKYAKPLSLYYNTPYDGYVYTEFGSVISSYKVPLKTLLKNMAVTYYLKTDKNTYSSRYIPVFYDTNIFSINAEEGTYASDTDEYDAVTNYSSNYWVTTGTTSHKLTSSLNFYNQIAFKVTETSKALGYISYDITSTALAALLDDTDEEYITLATGREVSGYTNATLYPKNDESIATLTLTYSKPELLEYVESSEDMATTITELGEAGILDAEGVSAVGYDAFTALDATRQAEICNTLAETDFATFDGFITVYDSLVNGDSTFTVYDVTITSGDTVYSDIASAVGQAVNVKVLAINEAPSGLVSILGAYDANGRLLTAEVANSNIEFSLTIPQGTSTIKLMCWDDIENRAPVCSALSK